MYKTPIYDIHTYDAFFCLTPKGLLEKDCFFYHAQIHAKTTQFQRQPVFSASMAKQDPELDSICGPCWAEGLSLHF